MSLDTVPPPAARRAVQVAFTARLWIAGQIVSVPAVNAAGAGSASLDSDSDVPVVELARAAGAAPVRLVPHRRSVGGARPAADRPPIRARRRAETMAVQIGCAFLHQATS